MPPGSPHEIIIGRLANLVGSTAWAGIILARTTWEESMVAEPTKAERILDAAQRVLAAEGFSGLTIAKVAEEAEVSRGLLHYYFESKEDMLAKMLRRSTEEAWGIVSGHLAEASSPADVAEGLAGAMRRYAHTHRGSLTLLAEGLALARNHPRIRDEMTALHKEGQDAFSERLEAMRAAGQAGFSMPSRGLTTVLIALFDGLGLELQTIYGLADDEQTWTAFRESVQKLLS